MSYEPAGGEDIGPAALHMTNKVPQGQPLAADRLWTRVRQEAPGARGVRMLAGVWAQVQTSGQRDFPFIYFLYSMVFNGLIGGFIGYFKNRILLGFILGALLSCIGWIIRRFLPTKSMMIQPM